MIQPKPYSAKCPKCGYVKVVRQKSDVINPLENKCPKCGSILVKTDDIKDKIIANLKDLF